jgi:hypothetical protein
VEANPEVFDCATCEVRVHEEALGWEERRALDLYHALRLSVVQDLALVPLVFDAYGLRMTRGEVRELLDLLEVVHRAARRPAPSSRDEEPSDG